MWWLGPYDWRDEEGLGVPGWYPPVGSRAGIDLRPVPVRSQPGPSSVGVGLFRADALDPGVYVRLGDAPDDPLTPTQRSAIVTLLGLPRLDAATLAEAMFEVLTLRAHPDGDLGVRPLLPTRAGRIEVWCGNRRPLVARRWRPDQPWSARTLDVVSRDYAAIRDDCLAGRRAPDVYLRWLHRASRLYYGSLSAYRAIQRSLPDETPLPPRTTLTESFDAADSDTLGPDQTWTEVAHDIDIVSNKAEDATPGTNQEVAARAEADLSSTDHYCQADIVLESSTLSAAHGVGCRFHASQYTFYSCAGRTNGTDAVAVVSFVNSTTGSTIFEVVQTVATSHVIKLIVSGSTLEAWYNGAMIGSGTDTAITSNTRCGIRGFARNDGNNGKWDNWIAGDLGAPQVRRPGRDPIGVEGVRVY